MKRILVFNDGEMQRDFTSIDGIVEGVVRAADNPPACDAGWDKGNPDPATSPAPWRVFNVGNSRPTQLLRYIEVIEECVGTKAKKEMLPLQAGDVPATWADVTELERAVGYRPSTPVETGVRRFVEWYREFYGA